MGNVKISVIVPVYNVENYLEICIESVISQKNFQDIELILIDDGSTDQSSKIIKKYTESYTNILDYYQENAGQSKARNKGIQHAKGEYIYFLDSDDLIPDLAMEHLYNLAVKEDLELILFEGKSFFDKSVDNMKIGNMNYERNKVYDKTLNGQDLFIEMTANKDFYASPCLQFIKKKVLLENTIYFLEGIIHEDELFSYQLLMKSKKVKCIKDKLFYRRIRLDSTITSLNYEHRIESLTKVIQKTIEFNSHLEETTVEMDDALNSRVNHLLGQCIIYCMEMSFKNRKKNYIQLKDIKLIILNNGYSVYRKYIFYFKHPEIYRILQKVLITIRKIKTLS